MFSRVGEGGGNRTVKRVLWMVGDWSLKRKDVNNNFSGFDSF